MESLREEMLVSQNKSKEIEILKDFDTTLSHKIIRDIWEQNDFYKRE